MTHQALYLKYRPQTFADLAGQAPVVSTLKRALTSGRVSHAYLFTGPRGTGKTTTARLLAKSINCAGANKKSAGEPDNTCAACQAISAGSFLDLIEIDAASNRGIDEIRELRDKVHIAPSTAKRKVYIIDEAHMLTKEAFNALLKTLEEPPSHAMFILATTEPDRLPATIISRCQRFDFRPAPTAIVAEQLGRVAKAEKITLEPAAADILAIQARGSFRDALSQLDVMMSAGEQKITADLAREVLGLADTAAVEALERALAAGDRAAALAAIRAAGEAGLAAEVYRITLLELLRELLLAKAGAPSSESLTKRAADWDLAQLTAAVRIYLAAGDLATDATVPELPLELATLELLSDAAEPAETAESAPAAPSTMNKDTTAAAPAPPPKQKVVAGSAAKQSPQSTVNSPQSTDGSQQKTGSRSTVVGRPLKDAQDVWERLLEATKQQYALSVCLQKTRPAGLSNGKLKLSVQSEFFMQKLGDEQTRSRVEAELEKLAGKPLGLELTLAKQDDDIFDTALKTFEGAQVQ